MQTVEQTTDRVKVEFEGGYFFLPSGKKRLGVYKEQVQPFLKNGYSTQKTKKRVSLIQKMIRAAGKIYEQLFPRTKHEVLNSIAFLTSNNGICNVTVEFIQNKLRERTAKFKGVEVDKVKSPSKSTISKAYAAIREHTGQFVFARLLNKGDQSNVILDTTHPNFVNLMKSIWDIDVVFDSSFLPKEESAGTPAKATDNPPENTCAQIAEPLSIAEFEQHLEAPIVFNDVIDNIDSMNNTLTKKNTVVNNECQEEKEESVPEVFELEKPTVYQDEKLAGMINSFLYNNQMSMSDMQRLYEIAMEFKTKCIPFGIDNATIFYEINDALKYIRNANNVRGYFYSTMDNKFKALTTPREIAETEESEKVSETKNDSTTPVEDSHSPEWFKRGDHKKRRTSEPNEAEKSEWAEKRKQINAKLGLDENGELQQKDKEDELIEKAIKSGATLPQWYKDKTYKQHASLKETDEEKQRKQVELLERAISDAEDGSIFKEVLQAQLNELKVELQRVV